MQKSARIIGLQAAVNTNHDSAPELGKILPRSHLERDIVLHD